MTAQVNFGRRGDVTAKRMEFFLVTGHDNGSSLPPAIDAILSKDRGMRTAEESAVVDSMVGPACNGDAAVCTTRPVASSGCRRLAVSLAAAVTQSAAARCRLPAPLMRRAAVNQSAAAQRRLPAPLVRRAAGRLSAARRRRPPAPLALPTARGRQSAAARRRRDRPLTLPDPPPHNSRSAAPRRRRPAPLGAAACQLPT